MTTEDWLRKAKALHQVCVQEQRNGNGSIHCTDKEAKKMNKLQHAIGSHHSIRSVTYNEMRASLDEMFNWVKGGKIKVS